MSECFCLFACADSPGMVAVIEDNLAQARHLDDRLGVMLAVAQLTGPHRWWSPGELRAGRVTPCG